MDPEKSFFSTSLPPFLPDEMIFLVDATGTRDLDDDRITLLDSLVREHGGYLEGGGRSLEMPLIERADTGAPRQVIPAKGLNARGTAEAYEMFYQMDQKLRAQGAEVRWQPNWLTGAVSGGPGGGGGSGAGPGTRPLPLQKGLGDAPLPLRKSLLQPLRHAATGAAPVRMIFLDSWNPDRSETARLDLPLYRLLNDSARGEPFRTRDYFASRDPDPFPMPDHGLFGAYLAGEVIGAKRVCVHESLLPEISEKTQGLAIVEKECVATMESVRVLDEYGAGDAYRLVEALAQIASSVQPGERVIVNMSLIVNIPDHHRLPYAFFQLFNGRWPGQKRAQGRHDRLDCALHEAILALHDKGVLLIAAAGNDSAGEERRESVRFPAAYDEVVDVTAACCDGSNEAWYANRATMQGVAVYAGDCDDKGILDQEHLLIGPFTDAHVPIRGEGEDPENITGTVAWAGTSFAAPLASGLAALLWAADPAQSAAEVRGKLLGLANGQTLAHGTPYIDLFDFV
ncbi:MAG: S8 family serine peptidase [Ardenticatenales bacterium]|nr:S8 family serine peptidase [Ardenticatenales bacterium]